MSIKVKEILVAIRSIANPKKGRKRGLIKSKIEDRPKKTRGKIPT